MINVGKLECNFYLPPSRLGMVSGNTTFFMVMTGGWFMIVLLSNIIHLWAILNIIIQL